MNKVTVTHMSQILNALQCENDVRLNTGTISLRNRPEYMTLLPVNNKTRNSAMIRYFTIDNIAKLVKIHDQNRGQYGIHPCRSLFQICTGVRFQNTILRDLADDKINWTTHDHAPNNRCIDLLTEGCCTKFRMHTKTGQEWITVPYNVVNCMKMLRDECKSKSSITIQKDYNAFLRKEFGCTSHDLRRCLCNSILNNKNNPRNTSGWKSVITMSQHYISKFPMQHDLVCHIESIRSRSRVSICSVNSM